MIVNVVLTILALLIGLFGIAVFIGVGEAANNAIAAFAAVSFPLALLAALFSWIAPRARWAMAAALCAPIGIVCLMSASMGSVYFPGGIWTVAITCLGAYLGARARQVHSGAEHTPLS